MYNILLCDDEQIVIDSLSFILEKNFEGQIEIFSAQSGTEALSIVSSHQIDIIFMDINMPGMNGLETISCILNLKPETVIMILSAFDSFNYAQEAINLGAFKYITKPVNRNTVVQNVRSAMNLVDSRRSKEGEESSLQKKLELVSPMIESDFFYSSLFNKKQDEDFFTYLDYFNIQETEFFISVLELTKSADENYSAIYSKIRELLHSHFKCLVSSLMGNRIVVLFPLTETAGSLSESVFNLISLNVTRKIKMGVSLSFEGINQMRHFYSQALEALNKAEEAGICYAEQTDESQKNRKSETPKKIMEQLLTRLKLGDSAGVQNLLESLTASYSEINAEPDAVKGDFFQLLVNALNSIRTINPAYEDKGFTEIFALLSKCQSIQEAENFMKHKLSDYTNAVQAKPSKKENATVKKVLEYINQNLNRDISLENAALEANVNPFYLSKLFRDETGTTFVNYISERRMEKAKNLLSETGLSIKEITALTGYNDQNYFSKLFRAKFGISPTDFRNSKGN